MAFNKNVLSKDSLDMKVFKKYATLNKSLENNRESIKMLAFLVTHVSSNQRNEPKKNAFDSFISYEDLKALKLNLTKDKRFTNLNYSNKRQVYYGINKEGDEILGVFVVKNNKVISFFPYVLGATVEPFRLDRPLDKKKKEYIKEFNKYVGA